MTKIEKRALEGETMQVTIELPKDVAEQLQAKWGDIPRRTLEAVAVEAYRSGELTSYQVRQMLEFETPMEFDALLKRAGVHREYSQEELEQDFKTSRLASDERSE